MLPVLWTPTPVGKTAAPRARWDARDDGRQGGPGQIPVAGHDPSPATERPCLGRRVGEAIEQRERWCQNVVHWTSAKTFFQNCFVLSEEQSRSFRHVLASKRCLRQPSFSRLQIDGFTIEKPGGRMIRRGGLDKKKGHGARHEGQVRPHWPLRRL